MTSHIVKACAVVVMACVVQGCVKKPVASVVTPVNTVTTADVTPPEGENTSGRLQTCLFEAEQLGDIPGGKYTEKKSQLYQAIRQAKYYASVAARISPDTAESMTPYYQFRINDICNDISRTMYNELKAGTLSISEKQ